MTLSIIFGQYLRIVDFPMGTNCVLLVADFFFFFFFFLERDFMLALSDNYRADVVEALKTTSRYLDHLLNIDNPYYEQTVSQIYPTELQLNKAISQILKPPFWT